jgi:hypothetical protein
MGAIPLKILKAGQKGGMQTTRSGQIEITKRKTPAFRTAKKSHINLDPVSPRLQVTVRQNVLNSRHCRMHSYLPTTPIRLQNIAQMKNSPPSVLTCNKENKQKDITFTRGQWDAAVTAQAV